MGQLQRIAAKVAKDTLSRTRVFSDRRFVKYRNDCFDVYTKECETIREAHDDIMENFPVFERAFRKEFEKCDSIYRGEYVEEEMNMTDLGYMIDLAIDSALDETMLRERVFDSIVGQHPHAEEFLNDNWNAALNMYKRSLRKHDR